MRINPGENAVRLPLIALILLGAVRLDAVVVRGGDHNDKGDWWNGAEEPYSFGELDGNGDGKVDATEWRAGRNQLERAIKETRAGLSEALDKDDSGKVSRYEAAEARPRLATLWAQAKALALAAKYPSSGRLPLITPAC
jgi:hypothetical protein